MERRKHYIDNLRSLCILLLVPFHAIMAYNCWGEANYIHFGESPALSAVNICIVPWYMALLFVFAGMSARYSLDGRTSKQFILERVRRLLVPLLLGVFTVVPVMAYYADVFHNGYNGGFYAHYGVFFTKFTDLTGYDGGFTPGHLWFLLYLFIISLVCLGITALQKRFLHTRGGRKLSYAQICLLGLLPTAAKPILDINGKSVGTFLTLYLIGYYLFSRSDVSEQIKYRRRISLAVFLVSSAADVYLFLWSSLSGGLLNTAFSQLALWFGILTAIGYGQKYLDFANKATKWLASNSFAFFFWHFMWLIICQFHLAMYLDGAALFAASVGLTYVLTFATVAVIRFLWGRLPRIRVLK